ncbi:hypothetical protein GCM10020360_15210 [Nonlabens tegetincola]
MVCGKLPEKCRDDGARRDLAGTEGEPRKHRRCEHDDQRKQSEAAPRNRRAARGAMAVPPCVGRRHSAPLSSFTARSIDLRCKLRQT